MERGVARPAWAEHAGAVEAGDCYVSSDAFCDRDEVICLFSYAGTEEHALVVVVDYNASGMLRDGWVTSQVTTLLERGRDLGGPDGSGGNGTAEAGFRRVSSPSARKLLESALLVTERAEDPPVSDIVPLLPRLRAGQDQDLAADGGEGAHGGSEVASLASTALSEPAVLVGRRTAWRSDRRGMLAAEFLASDEAEDLSDLEAASRCADRIVDYGCDQDFGRPLRVSPAKMETFLLDWLPRKVMLTRSEQHAMPHVLLAWARWAGAKSGLDAAAIGKTLDAVFDSMSAFSKVYRDPSSFGLQPGLVARLLPDRDLEALPRRAFAFGVLDGTSTALTSALLDPADDKDRRILLAADHDGRSGKPATPEHLAEHLALDRPALARRSARTLGGGAAPARPRP